MNLSRTLRRTAVAAAAAGSAAVVFAAVPAQAASAGNVRPLEAEGCSSNICLQVSGSAGSTVQVIGWAKSTTYTGTLTLTGPGGLDRQESGTWLKNKDNDYIWNVGSAPSGQYCVSGYSTSGTHEGTACETVS